MKSYQPIGIFDSGVGGLAVARVIKNLLPHEPIYYLGDTARLPYGEQTTEALQKYTHAIGDWLLAQNCKVILIACNTATAAAAEQLQQQVGSQIPVLNVIDPVIAYIKAQYLDKTIGLIATNYTVQSDVYTKKLQALHADIRLKVLPTPSLVPMVESNHVETDILADYLADPKLSHIDALILGCTHYWLIKHQIQAYYHNKIPLIDGASLLAYTLQGLLKDRHIEHPKQIPAQDYFVATKLTTNFQLMIKRLFHASVQLINLPS